MTISEITVIRYYIMHSKMNAIVNVLHVFGFPVILSHFPVGCNTEYN